MGRRKKKTVSRQNMTSKDVKKEHVLEDKETGDTAQGGNADDMGKDGRLTIKDWIDILIAIGTIVAAGTAVFAACIAKDTLKEMKTELENSYRPEIVIEPNTFDGGLENEEDGVGDRKRFYINYNAPDPDNFYFDRKAANGCLYLETPYLTLKNIGQGTAKDVQITFSGDWLPDAVDSLNSINDGYNRYSYSLDPLPSNMYDDRMILLKYADTSSGSDKKGVVYLTRRKDLIKKITYIAAGDTAVKVELPEGWITMFSILCGQSFQKNVLTKNEGSISRELSIPDLTITIQYSDMLGNTYTETQSIPWTGHYQCIWSDTTAGNEMDTVLLWTGFYEDYIR